MSTPRSPTWSSTRRPADPASAAPLIPPVPLPRKLNRAQLQAPGRSRDSVLAAGLVLDHVRAEVVVGFAGHVAGLAYLAARRRACRSLCTRRTLGPEWPTGRRPG